MITIRGNIHELETGEPTAGRIGAVGRGPVSPARICRGEPRRPARGRRTRVEINAAREAAPWPDVRTSSSLTDGAGCYGNPEIRGHGRGVRFDNFLSPVCSPRQAGRSPPSRYTTGSTELPDAQLWTYRRSSRRHLLGPPWRASQAARHESVRELLGRLFMARGSAAGRNGFPVSASGHQDRIGRRTGGEGCFHAGEFGVTASGFPVVSTD